MVYFMYKGIFKNPSVHFKYKGTSQNSYVGNALMDLKAWINLKTMEIPVT